MEPVRAVDYHDIVRVSDPRLAPGGERVAFVRTTPIDGESYESTVYVVPTSGGEPRRFTASSGRDSEPRWSPDGDRLAFVSSRGEDDDRAQLWVLPTDGGEARQVTDVVGGVSSIAWSPDGTRIAFAQKATVEDRKTERDLELDDPEYESEPPDPRVIDRLVYRADGRYFDGRRSHVYVVDLGTDTVTRRTEGDYDYRNPAWGDETTLYLTVKRTGDPDDSIVHDIVSYDTTTGEAETITQTTGWNVTVAPTSDGRIAYPRTPERKASMRQTELEVFDTETGETVNPTESLDRTVVGAARWDDDEATLYFRTPDGGGVVLRRVPGDASAAPETVVADGEIGGFDVGADHAVYATSEWDHPGDVFVADPDGAGTNRLTRVNESYLEERAVAEPEELRFESADGVEVQGWVLTPPTFDEAEQYPLVVEVHGGPHSMYSTSGTMWHELQTLAARGYVVFWCNPRGSIGYGESFAMAIEREWGPVTMRDVLAGADLVEAREYVDETNQFLTGGSFGGYMTGWIVGHTDRFAGAVAQRGVYDLASFYGSTDAFNLVEWEFGTAPWEDPSFLWAQSPVATVEAVTTPTLVLHADDDFRVPVNNGEMFYLFLQQNGVETRLVRYPREGHELSRSGEPDHVVDRIERIARWFDGYSAHHDVPKALDRGDDGLSVPESDDD